MKIRNLSAIAILVVISLSACKTKKAEEESTYDSIPVKTMTVEYTTESAKVLVSGNIEGNKTVRLGFMVAGKIDFIAAEEGETIKKGQLLASLDSENYSIAKDMADAKLDQAQDDYTRLNELHQRRSISESDYSKVSNALKVAKAQQRLQSKNLEDTKLFSPIKGVLLKKGVEEGEIIDKGLQLFAVSDIYTVKANASVPESELQHVKIGNSASVYIASLDSSFTGKIVEIGTLADPATRTFNVKVELQNQQLLIRPGMTAELNLDFGQTTQIIALPAEAVLRDLDNSAYVYVIDKTDDKAFKRLVTLGKIIGNKIEITSGLSDQDTVVVAGQFKLTNGCSVIFK